MPYCLLDVPDGLLPKILVTDDDHDTAETLAVEHYPALVWLDSQLRGETGQQVIEAFCQIPGEPGRIVIASGSPLAGELAPRLNVGFLPKPFTTASVASTGIRATSPVPHAGILQT